MNRIKSLFITSWITSLFAGVCRAIWSIWQSPASNEWYWVLLALTPGALFFVWLLIGNVARSAKAPRAVFALTLVPLMAITITGVSDFEVWFWIAVVGTLGSALYEWWYSRFSNRDAEALAIGKPLPSLQFELPDGTTLQTASLKKPLLMIFYRGNWCPLCMAQVKEIAAQYRSLADKGVEVMLISPQPHSETASLAKKFSAPMTFLVDTNNRMAEKLGIKAEAGLPIGLEALGYESDTVMPTVIMTDANGTIIFADLTDNYRVRPEPQLFLEVFAKAGI